MQTSKLRDYKVKEYRLPVPPLFNVMYCVRVSLWTVKTFLAQCSPIKDVSSSERKGCEGCRNAEVDGEDDLILLRG